MKTAIRLMAFATGILAAQVAVAQAPPAGSTGQCKDGTYSTAASKQGACRGHQGVKEWYAAAPAAATSAAAHRLLRHQVCGNYRCCCTGCATSAAAQQLPLLRRSLLPRRRRRPRLSAPGGGPGMVWLNTSSNVYHCYGGEDYGTTKAGAYMSEADAKAKGAHADHGKACTK